MHHKNRSKDHQKKDSGDAEKKDSAMGVLEDNLNDSNLTHTTKGAMNRTSNNFSVNSKGETLGVSNQKAIKKVKLLPKNLFPHLHEKTMFKAAIEYSMGNNQQTTRSLNDHNLSIEKQVLDGQAKL